MAGNLKIKCGAIKGKRVLGVGVNILKDKTPKAGRQNKEEVKGIKGENEKD